MALAVIASGTVTPTTTAVEQSLGTGTTSKTFVFIIDLFNLAGVEQLDIRIAMKVLSGGTARTVMKLGPFVGVQDVFVKVSIPIPVPVAQTAGIEAFITQTGGVMRAFPWSLITID